MAMMIYGCTLILMGRFDRVRELLYKVYSILG